MQDSDIMGAACTALSTMGSDIRRMFQMGAQLKLSNPQLDLIDLSLGNPDLEPPDAVHDALKKIVSHKVPGCHRYMDNAGFADVRQFLAGRIGTEQNVTLNQDNVFMTCGAAGGIQIVMRTVLSPGDEVMVFAPFFSEYLPYTANFNCTLKVLATGDNHQPVASVLKEQLTRKTRLLVLNSPNNPSGVVYDEVTLRQVAEVIKEHNDAGNPPVHVLCDEPYANLSFSGVTLPKVLSIFKTGWLVRSHSKDLGLAGERIGYVVWASDLNKPVTLFALRNAARSLGFVNAPALMQRLLPHVYDARVDTQIYEQRSNAFVQILREGGLKCAQPGGTFFVFPSCGVLDDRKFCEDLVGRGVIAVPGSGFGKSGFLRCSLSQDIGQLLIAAKRIVRLYGDCIQGL